MTRSADFFRPVEAALAMLEEAEITSFPVSLKQILRHRGIRLFSYEDYCRVNGCSMEECVEWYGQDAATIFNSRGFLILINKNQMPRHRIRFTIAHELGHIVLGHLQEIGPGMPGKLPEDHALYEVMEVEANCFARNLLCPAPAVQRLFRLYGYTAEVPDMRKMRTVRRCRDAFLAWPGEKLSDAALVERAFYVTASAAETRLRTLEEDLKRTDRSEAARITQEMQFTAAVRCLGCEAPRVPGAAACYACGAKGKFGFFVSEAGKELPEAPYYDKATCHLSRCPVCGRRSYASELTYCIGCGLSLINECEGITDSTGAQRNRHPNPPFARYCLRCGKPTAFHLQNLITEDGKLTLPVAPEKKTQEKPDPEPFSPDCFSLPEQEDRICPRCGTGNRKWRTDCRVCQCPLDNTCPACGTENTPDARYCACCGKPTPFERYHAFDVAVQQHERAMARNILALYATRGIYYEWDNGPGQGEPR